MTEPIRLTDNPAPWISAGVLREADRRMWFLREADIRATIEAASWRCGFIRGEAFIGCAWTWIDGPGRGWVGLLAGTEMDEGPRVALGRMIHVSAAEMHRRCGADTLRSWINHEDARAKKFAEAFGLRYDCGPATGFGPDGEDYDLYLWRRE